MDVANLVIDLQAKGIGAEVIKQKLMEIGATAEEAAAIIAVAHKHTAEGAKEAAQALESARFAAEMLFQTVAQARGESLTHMEALVNQIRSEATLLREAQTAFGRYAPITLDYSREMRQAPLDVQAAGFMDTVLGEGTANKVERINAETRAYQQTLSGLIGASGGVTSAVLRLADAFETTTPAIEKTRIMQEAMGGASAETVLAFQAEVSAIEQKAAALRVLNAEWERSMGITRQNTLLAPTSIPNPPSTPVNVRQQYYNEVDQLFGEGTYAGLLQYNESLTAQQHILNLLIDRYGLASKEVAEYAAATGVSTRELEAYQAEAKRGFFIGPTGPPQGWVQGPNGAYYNPNSLGPVLGPPAPTALQQSYSNLDVIGGQGTSEALQRATAAAQANRTVLRQLVAEYGTGSRITREFATSIGVSEAALAKMGVQTGLQTTHLSQLVRGMLAGFFQFSLLAGSFVIIGRALSLFTVDAVKAFNTLEAEAANLATVEPKLNLKAVEDQLQRLQLEVPATLKEIATAAYEIASLGNQSAQVTEALTASVTRNAKMARADVKTWADDTVLSMNQFNLWGQTAQETYANAEMVQAKFFQAAKDSQATPKELAESYGNVALAVQQMGGSMDDTLALMVAASQGVGPFDQKMTNLARALQELNQPNTRATLEGWGIALTDAGNNANSFLDVLKQMDAYFQSIGATGAQRQALIEEAFPQQRGTRGIQTMLEFLDRIDQEYPKLQQSQAEFFKDQQRYMATSEVAMQKYENAWQVLSQDIGSALSPPVLLKNLATSPIGEVLEDLMLKIKGVQSVSADGFGMVNRGSFDPWVQLIHVVDLFKDQLRAINVLTNALVEPASAVEKAFGFDKISDWAKQVLRDFGIVKDSAGEVKAQIGAIAQVGKPSVDTMSASVGVLKDGMSAAEDHTLSLNEMIARLGQEGVSSLDSLNSAAQAAARTFGIEFSNSILAAMSVVTKQFEGFPSDVMDALNQAALAVNQNNPALTGLSGPAGQLVGNIKEITNELRDQAAHPERFTSTARQELLRSYQEQLNALKALHDSQIDLFDPMGAEGRAKQAEQNAKQIEQLRQEQERTDALAFSTKRIADAQQHAADVTAHWNAQIQILRDSAESLQRALSSLSDLQTTLTKKAQEATEGGLALNTFRETTGPQMIEDWRKKQVDSIEAVRRSSVAMAQAQDASAEEIATRITAINTAAASATDTVNTTAQKAKDALASIPDGLTQTKTEFENTIKWYQDKIRELQTSLSQAQAELTRRQNVVFNQTPSSSATAGLRGPFTISNEELASANPSFLNAVPGRLSAALGGANATNSAIEELRKLIQDPIVGGGFLGPFMQTLADAKAKLREDQAAAEDARRAFAARNFELENAQFDLNQRRTAANRPLEDRQYELSQQMYEARQRENAAMRPLNEELYQYNLQLQAEQDRMTAITRQYDAQLIPLQREMNELRREQNRLAREEEQLNQEQSLQNQQATLAKLTPGTAQYLAVRQGLARAEAEYALKQKEYSLQDRIDAITEERDAAVQSEQARIDALSDVIRAHERERDAAQHKFDLERQGIQDQTDLITHQQDVLNHGFDMEQRIIDDKRTLLEDEQRRYEYNQSIREANDQKNIAIAEIELEWATRASNAWTGFQQTVVQGYQDQINGWQAALEEISNRYQTWSDTKLKPVQDNVNKIIESFFTDAKNSIQAAIDAISAPGTGLISQLEIQATQQETAANRSVNAWRAQDAALKDYYDHLLAAAKLVDLIQQGKYGDASKLPPFTVVPPIPNVGGGNNQPGVSPPAPTMPPSRDQQEGQFTTKTVGIYPIGAPGTIGTGENPTGFNLPADAWGLVSNLADALSTLPQVAQSPQYSTATTLNFYGNIMFQGGGPYNTQADADRDGRRLLRAMSNYMNVTGTNSGWGAGWGAGGVE